MTAGLDSGVYEPPIRAVLTRESSIRINLTAVIYAKIAHGVDSLEGDATWGSAACAPER